MAIVLPLPEVSPFLGITDTCRFEEHMFDIVKMGYKGVHVSMFLFLFFILDTHLADAVVTRTHELSKIYV